MKKGMMIISLIMVIGLIGIGFVVAEGYTCADNANCKINVCSTVCVNDSFTTTQGVACSYPPSRLPDYCKCENNTCKGYKATAGPTSSDCQQIATKELCNNYGANICSWDEQTNSCAVNNKNLVGNDSDSHGCKGSAGYSWCEEKKKCLRVWEENCSSVNNKKSICGDGVCAPEEKAVLCAEPRIYPNGSMMGSGGCNMVCPQDCNKTLPGEGKVKILPETASQRARERLGELGFNVSLKEVGSGNQTKSYYEVSAEKEGKMFGLFKVKGKVSADVDDETGEVMKVHKPWWGFMAGI